MGSRFDFPDGRPFNFVDGGGLGGFGGLMASGHPRVAAFFASLDRMSDGLENLVKNHRPTLGGERYLTDKEVSARLRVSRRALQDYRNGGRLPYYKLGGKNLYRESDIQRMLDANYQEAFK